METISLKIEEEFLERMTKDMKESGFSTKTEFIREALRDKMEEIERELLIKEFPKFRGKASKKTTPEENKKTAEAAVIEMAKAHGWKI